MSGRLQSPASLRRGRASGTYGIEGLLNLIAVLVWWISQNQPLLLPQPRLNYSGGNTTASCYNPRTLCETLCRLHYVGFEVLTPVVMKSAVFWDITPCSPLKVNQRESRWQAGILLGLIDPEDGGDMFLGNVRWLSADYTVLYPRR
jgi:hypothetical protein